MQRRALLGGLSLATLAAASGHAQSFLGGAVAPVPTVADQTPRLDDTTAQNFNRIVIARWGDAVLPNAPPFNPYPLTADAGQHAISL